MESYLTPDTMIDPLSLAISVLSLAVSSVTAWLTLFRRGTVKISHQQLFSSGPTALIRAATKQRRKFISELFCSLHRSVAASSRVCTWRFLETSLIRISTFGFMASVKSLSAEAVCLLAKRESRQPSLSYSEGREFVSLYRGTLQARRICASARRSEIHAALFSVFGYFSRISSICQGARRRLIFRLGAELISLFAAC